MAVTAPRGFGQEAAQGKCDAKAETKADAPMTNTYKCDRTGKTWTQPATEKKACPTCGAAAPECGALVKSEPAGKTVWSCRMHKFVCEEKSGRCKICNLTLVEVSASSVPKKVGKGGKVAVTDTSKEPEECEKTEE
jgi:hypothetical protein